MTLVDGDSKLFTYLRLDSTLSFYFFFFYKCWREVKRPKSFQSESLSSRIANRFRLVVDAAVD